jgi:hypothetical protein
MSHVLPSLLYVLTLKGRTQYRMLPALCGVWGRVSLSAKSYPHNMQRLGLESGTFRLQTVGSTAAPVLTLAPIFCAYQTLCCRFYLCYFLRKKSVKHNKGNLPFSHFSWDTQEICRSLIYCIKKEITNKSVTPTMLTQAHS